MPPSGFLAAPSPFTVDKLPGDCYAAQKADTAFLGAAKRLVRNSTRARVKPSQNGGADRIY